VGEKIKVVVMGKTDRNYLELSAKDNEIAQAERSNGLHLWRPDFDSLVVGDKVAAVCCEREKSGLWACVTPSLKGRIDKLEASDDIDDLNDFENRHVLPQQTPTIHEHPSSHIHALSSQILRRAVSSVPSCWP